jgi:hypothetical protein
VSRIYPMTDATPLESRGETKKLHPKAQLFSAAKN